MRGVMSVGHYIGEEREGEGANTAGERNRGNGVRCGERERGNGVRCGERERVASIPGERERNGSVCGERGTSTGRRVMPVG
jgi:hypothetical protein